MLLGSDRSLTSTWPTGAMRRATASAASALVPAAGCLWPAPVEAPPCVACRSAPVHKDDSVNRFARGIACCILGALGLLTACEGDRPESLITSAKGYIVKNDFQAAAIQLTALQKEPNSS